MKQLTDFLADFSGTMQRAEGRLLQQKRRAAASSALGAVVVLSVGIILIATLGMISLQILATSGTTSFQPSVVTMMVVVVPIIFAVAVIIVLLKHGAGIHI